MIKMRARIVIVTYQQLGNPQWSAGVLAQTRDLGSIAGLDRHDRNIPSCLRTGHTLCRSVDTRILQLDK